MHVTLKFTCNTNNSKHSQVSVFVDVFKTSMHSRTPCLSNVAATVGNRCASHLCSNRGSRTASDKTRANFDKHHRGSRYVYAVKYMFVTLRLAFAS